METTESIVIATEPNDVKVEVRLENLNKKGFVRAPTAKSQWHVLVNEAWQTSRLPVDEVMKGYLVTMLERFMTRARLLEELEAFDYCQHIFGVKSLDAPCIQDAADMSLQYVAFFPERSRYRHSPRSVEYVANIGVALYQELARASEGKDDCISIAYRPMANYFGRAVMVLRSAVPPLQSKPVRELLRNGLHIPSALEAEEKARTIGEFHQMYFEQDYQKTIKYN